VEVLAALGRCADLGAVNPISFAGREGFVKRQIFQIGIECLAIHLEGWRAVRARLARVGFAIGSGIRLHPLRVGGQAVSIRCVLAAKRNAKSLNCAWNC